MAGKKAVGNIFRKFANIRYVFGKNGFQIEDNYWSRKLNIVGKAQRPKKKGKRGHGRLVLLSKIHRHQPIAL